MSAISRSPFRAAKWMGVAPLLFGRSMSAPPRIRISAIARFLFFKEMRRGVSSAAVTLSITGSYPSSFFTASVWSLATANTRGDAPSAVSEFISAPLAINLSISSLYPLDAATIRLLSSAPS